MQPFALALGLDNAQFGPWREAIFTDERDVLLVEGDIDVEYLNLLRDPMHGERRLRFEGKVFAYGGKDGLKQRQLLKFIKGNYKRFVVTYDLDAEAEVEPLLQEVGLQRNVGYIAIGKSGEGKQNIEGLLPESVLQCVFNANTDLVQKALNGLKDQQKSARNALKRLYLEEFKKNAKPGEEYYKDFYVLTKQLNKMLA